MGFGRVDRGGSREGKKSSLRGSKQDIQKKAKEALRGIMGLAQGTLSTTSPAPPPLSAVVLEAAAAAAKNAAVRILKASQDGIQAGPGQGGAFGGFLGRPADVGGSLLIPDCASQLVNRQFDRDQTKVLQRALDAGVAPLVAFTSDFEKQETLARFARENAGVVYCCVGVHSDNIKRTNERLSASRLEEFRVLCLLAETVAVLCGVDLSRDAGVRYAQERAMEDQMAAAVEFGLPLLLYEVRAANVLLEKIQEFRSGDGKDTRIAIHNFTGTESEARAFVEQGCMVMVSGRICDPGEKGEALRQAIAAAVPLNRLLLASEAPLWTPQNIPDVFVKETRNEPSNIPYAAAQLATLYDVGIDAISEKLFANALQFYGIPEKAAVDKETEAAAAAPAGHKKEIGTKKVGEEGEDEGEDEDSDEETDADEAKREGAVGGLAAAAAADLAQEMGELKVARGEEKKKTTTISSTTTGDGPSRAVFACRSCRKHLFGGGDLAPPHAADEGDVERVDHRWQRDGCRRRRGGVRPIESALCSMHFLRGDALPAWVQGQVVAYQSQSRGEELAAVEGRLSCPFCNTKLGKWAAGAAAENTSACGVSCSCGTRLLAPAFGVLKTRIDLIDAEMNVETAAQRSLQVYAEVEERREDMTSFLSAQRGRAVDASGAACFFNDNEEGDSDLDEKSKKRKSKVRASKTGNFSSFRNKSYGVKTPAAAAGGSAAAAADGGAVGRRQQTVVEDDSEDDDWATGTRRGGKGAKTRAQKQSVSACLIVEEGERSETPKKAAKEGVKMGKKGKRIQDKDSEDERGGGLDERGGEASGVPGKDSRVRAGEGRSGSKGKVARDVLVSTHASTDLNFS